MGQLQLFGVETQLKKLTKMGDKLIAMKEKINWEMFRQIIEKAIRKADYSKGGRPPWDVVLIFGYMTRFMGGMTLRCHGIKRAYRDICNKNLAYNLKRYVCIAG